MALPRMRTAEKALEIIKAEDPGSEVTLHFIRAAIKSGKVPVTCVGRKRLVDVDAFMYRIAAGGDLMPEPPKEDEVGRFKE